MRSPTSAALTFLLASGAACASPGTGTTARSDTEVILRAEIDASQAANAFDLVQSHRPQWLRARGIHTFAEAAGEEALVVYLDNARLGPPETMREVGLGSVQYLRHFDAKQATQRWGAGHLQGAILISTQALPRTPDPPEPPGAG